MLKLCNLWRKLSRQLNEIKLLSIFADMIQSQKHARNLNSAGEFIKRELCSEAINKNQLSIPIRVDVTATQTISKRRATA